MQNLCEEIHMLSSLNRQGDLTVPFQPIQMIQMAMERSKRLDLHTFQIFIVLLHSLLPNGMSSLFACPSNINTACVMTHCNILRYSREIVPGFSSSISGLWPIDSSVKNCQMYIP